MRREGLRFALPGFVALLVVATGASWVALNLSTDEAARDARDDAEILARGVVEPGVTEAVLEGDADALGYLDAVVRSRVLSGRVVGVRLWAEDGTIVYANEPDLIGERFAKATSAFASWRTSPPSTGPT